jgi:DNA-binding NtrC family response regulator
MPTVLLVEDDADVLRVLRQVLQKNGYTMLEAGGAGEAFEVSGRFSGEIDLLITDVVLPQVSCNSLVGRLRGQRPDLKVLYISGYAGEILSRYGVPLSEPNFLQKPFTVDALTRKIQQVLDLGGGQVRTAGA